MYHERCKFEQDRLCGPRTNTYEFKSIKNHPLEATDEPECIMYHGTSWEATLSILSEGFDSRCYQPTAIGAGTYLAPCVRMATSHTVDKIVIMCRVKLGQTKIFDLCFWSGRQYRAQGWFRSRALCARLGEGFLGNLISISFHSSRRCTRRFSPRFAFPNLWSLIQSASFLQQC